MMKQSIGKWNEDEIRVAKILVQLPELIPAHDFSRPLFSWGVKRRRSAMAQPPPVAGETPVKKGNGATSPATPLMFSPSESEDKSKAQSPLSVCKRKNKEELMQTFADLTHQKYSLVKEMEAVKRHLDSLRASNLELKNRKQKIYGLAPPALGTTPHHHQHQQQHHQQQQLHYAPYPHLQQQQIFTQWNSSFIKSSPAAAAVGIRTGNKKGLPDLNMKLDETLDVVMMTTDYKTDRALASAQARKRRMQIHKEKKVR